MTEKVDATQIVEDILTGKNVGTFSHSYITFPLFCKTLEMMKYSIRTNACNDDIEVNGRVLTDLLEGTIKSRLVDFARDNGLKLPKDDIRDHMLRLAAKQSYHPIREYLESLEWDGQDHIINLAGYFTDKEQLFARWLQAWLVGAVARIYEQWQNPMLVLDGPQDLGKSHFAEWLCSPLPLMFKESSILPEYKAHRIARVENWVWEVQELGATTRKADQESLKAFLSDKMTKDLKPYGVHPIHKTNAASYIGTINNEAGFLTDRTGNRRYLVCALTGIDWGYAQKIDIDQVWGQAYHWYTTGNDWKLTDDEKAYRDMTNEEYLVDDPIEIILSEEMKYTGDDKDRVSSNDIQTMLVSRAIRPTRSAARSVKGILVSWGCEHKNMRINGKQSKGYNKVKMSGLGMLP